MVLPSKFAVFRSELNLSLLFPLNFLHFYRDVGIRLSKLLFGSNSSTNVISLRYKIRFRFSEVANRNSGTEALVSCLQVSDPEIEAIAAGGLTAITNLALEEATRTKILQAVSSKLLVPLLESK